MSDDLGLPNESALPECRRVSPLPALPISASRRPWLLRLETWLVLAAIGLAFQMYPALFWGLLYWIDVRSWTWGVWVGVEIAVLVILLGLWRWQYSGS
jgi:hypothetical protein